MITFVPQDCRLLRPSYLRLGPQDADVLFVLLHGFPDSARAWEPLMKALPESALKVAPFTPGTDGMAPTARKEFSLAAQLDRITRLIRFVQDGVSRRTILVGHDLGGALVSPLQEELGTTITGSVYINSMSMQLFYKRKGRIDQLLRSFYMVLFQLPFLTRRTLGPVAKWFLRIVYDLGGLAKDDELRKDSGDVLWGIEIYRQYARVLIRQFRRPIKKEATPTLFLHGVHDPFIMTPTNDELRRFFEDVKLVTLEAGHWPQRVVVDEVCRHITEFVSESALNTPHRYT